MRTSYKGFTLTEMTIALAIIAILVTVSVVMFTSSVRKGRRADAADTISAIQLAEERYRTSNTTYGTLAQVWGGVSSSPGGYYTLAISGTSATGYTITATAVGDQANDTQDGTSCRTFTVAVSNGTVTQSPSVCWPQ